MRSASVAGPGARWALSSIGGVLLVAHAGCRAAPPAELVVPSPTASVAPLMPAASAPASPAPVPPTAASAPAPEREVCASDADCVLSSFVGCCACCPCGPLHATTAAHEARAKAVCAAESCPACKGASGACPACRDPADEGMHARCMDAVCTLVETKARPAAPAPIACNTDDDCWLDAAHAPTARPSSLRGKVIRPCKDGEHAPSCVAGACAVRRFKC